MLRDKLRLLRMNRGTAIALVAAPLAVAAVFLMCRKDPAASGPQDARPLKRPRVASSPAPLPVVGGFSGTLPLPTPPADWKANVLLLLAKGEVLSAQVAISEWFSADPIGARDWLEAQPALADFQPAISGIARNIAEAGHPVEALEWAELLESGPEREQTIFQIYATGRRYHWLSDEQVRAAPFAPEKITDLLSGAADD